LIARQPIAAHLRARACARKLGMQKFNGPFSLPRHDGDSGSRLSPSMNTMRCDSVLGLPLLLLYCCTYVRAQV
jgi:hypothetical protein